MPIDYVIDHARRRVMAEGRGVVSSDEVFRYQRDVWSRADVAGYDEMVDMSGAEGMAGDSRESIRGLADLSARMDTAAGESRFAIVAPQESLFGLGRMYETYRALDQRSTKRVGVFRDRDEALRWLEGIEPEIG